MKKNTIFELVVSGLFVALGLLLPKVFHAFSMGGPIFLPMHIPVLLCGLICGWKYGLLVGIILPLLSSVTTGMPVLFPTAFAMTFELGTYGLVSGVLGKKMNTYVALIGAMICGRAVVGVANMVLLGMAGKAYTFTAFLTASFVTALPGIAVQLVFIPLIVIALQKSRISGLART